MDKRTDTWMGIMIGLMISITGLLILICNYLFHILAKMG